MHASTGRGISFLWRTHHRCGKKLETAVFLHGAVAEDLGYWLGPGSGGGSGREREHPEHSSTDFLGLNAIGA